MASFSQGALIEQVSSVTASGSVITLAASDKQIQYVTGSATQTFKLPDATTLKVGRSFEFVNETNAFDVIIRYSDNRFLTQLPCASRILIKLVDKSTINGTWEILSVGVPPQPLMMHAHVTAPDDTLYFTASEVRNVDGTGSSVGPQSATVPSIANSSSLKFTSPHTSTGATFDITWPTSSTVGYFNRVGFSLLSSGTIKAIFATEQSSYNALANAGSLFVTGATPLGWVDLKAITTDGQYKTAFSTSSIIENQTSGTVNIHRFGSGAGGGSGSGSGNELLERLKNEFDISSYQYLTANVFSADGTTLTDGSSTGAMDLTDSSYSLGSGQQWISTNLLDSDFYSSETDLPQVDLTAFWKYGNIDTAATYSVSRNGLSSDFNTISMPQLGSTDAFKGSVTFTEPTLKATFTVTAANATAGATYINNGATFTVLTTITGGTSLSVSYPIGYGPADTGTLTKVSGTGDTTITFSAVTLTSSLFSHAVGTGTPGTIELNATTQQRVGQPFTVVTGSVFNTAMVYISKTGSPGGSFTVNLVRDSSGPSTTSTDTIAVSNTISIGSLSAGNNVVPVQFSNTALKAGTYHLVIVPDSAYTTSFVAATHSVSVRYNSAAGTLYKMSSGTWGSSAGTAYYVLLGRVLDLRIKIVASAASKKLMGAGIFYALGGVPIVGKFEQQTFTFTGSSNTNAFTVTNFLPNPSTLKVYRPDTGQVWAYPTLQINGQVVTFPANSFYLPSTDLVTLIFDQTGGAAVDTSDANATNIATLTNRADAVGSQIDEFKRVALPLINVPNTTIVGRAQIPDLSQDLGVRTGIERIMIQQIVELQSEFGASGERVFGVLNDSLGLIRFVGNWTSESASNGQLAYNFTTSDYIEITFYGSGLNLLSIKQSSAQVWQYAVDGGSATTFETGSGSTVLAGRKYNANQVMPVVSGLSVGMHTVKITVPTGTLQAMAVEILNEGIKATANTTTSNNQLTSVSVTTGVVVGATITGAGIPAGTTVTAISGTTVTMSANATATATGVTVWFTGMLNVRPGTYYANAKANTLATASFPIHNSTFESGTLGSRGGRVSVYLKSDGTVAKSVQAVASSGSALGSSATINGSALSGLQADHVRDNEEFVITYRFNEFAAGRSDDFASNTISTGYTSAAFTLDDGTTTLVANNATALSLASNIGLFLNNPGTAYFILTFVGTGLDILCADGGATIDTHSVTVDGVSVGNLTAFGTGNVIRVRRICSGLPYGTHTVKILRAGGGNGVVFYSFITYGPKKPTLPTGALELADFNVMANFVANSTQDPTTISTGVLRKCASREWVYVQGTTGSFDWGVGISFTSNRTMFECSTDRLNASAQYTFWGTGFDFRFDGYTNSSANISVTIDTLAATTAFFPNLVGTPYGAGVTFSGGVLDQLVGATQPGSGLVITGLPLGLHTVKFLNNTASAVLDVSALDIITPIHSPKSNLYGDLQNTLPVGSQGIQDDRKLQVLPTSTQKAWAQAVGVTADPTTGATSAVPMPDMSVMIRTAGGPLEISYTAPIYNSVSPSTNRAQIYVDGVAVGKSKTANAPAINFIAHLSDCVIVPVSAGPHKVDVYWWTNTGSLTRNSTESILTVQEK